MIFHAHIYFEQKTAELAQKLANQVSAKTAEDPQWRASILGVSRLIHRPIGPHPLPMFEVDFKGELLGAVVQWLHSELQKTPGALKVLVHEDREPETLEHTVNAIWIGGMVNLDLSQLDRGTNQFHQEITQKS